MSGSKVKGAKRKAKGKAEAVAGMWRHRDLTGSEATEDRQERVEDAIREMLHAIGDDPSRPGLVDTPKRVAKAWLECWGASYNKTDTSDLVRLFDEPDLHGTQMVTVAGIAFHSHCEHHMAAFHGAAHISYVPSKKGVIGLSKLARVVEHFSRRLQVQERLTNQIADFLEDHLSTHVAVMMEASHGCMVSRGVMQPNAKTITSALRGDYYKSALTREEFYRAIGR